MRSASVPLDLDVTSSAPRDLREVLHLAVVARQQHVVVARLAAVVVGVGAREREQDALPEWTRPRRRRRRVHDVAVVERDVAAVGREADAARRAGVGGLEEAERRLVASWKDAEPT